MHEEMIQPSVLGVVGRTILFSLFAIVALFSVV